MFTKLSALKEIVTSSIESIRTHFLRPKSTATSALFTTPPLLQLPLEIRDEIQELRQQNYAILLPTDSAIYPRHQDFTFTSRSPAFTATASFSNLPPPSKDIDQRLFYICKTLRSELLEYLLQQNALVIKQNGFNRILYPQWLKLYTHHNHSTILDLTVRRQKQLPGCWERWEWEGSPRWRGLPEGMPGVKELTAHCEVWDCRTLLEISNGGSFVASFRDLALWDLRNVEVKIGVRRNFPYVRWLVGADLDQVKTDLEKRCEEQVMSALRWKRRYGH